jgi:hypothetical protein
MPNETIITAVLDLLTDREYRPVDLLAELRKRGFSQADAKEAMSHLVHGQRVELTPDRILRSAVLAHA